MKNSLIITILLIVLLYTPSKSQNIETVFGEPFQLENSNRIKIIGCINNEYYLSRVESREITKLSTGYNPGTYLNLTNSPKLLTFNSQFKLLRETSVPSLNVNGTKHKLQNILPGNNCFYINSVYVDKNADQKVRIIQTLKDNNTLSDNPIYIDTFNNNSIFLKDEITDFDFSPDSSKVLAIHSNPTKRSENYSLSMKVYNDKFELQWARNISVPFAEKDFEFRSSTISDEGKIYILGLVSVKSDKRKKIYKIISIDKTEEIKLFDFETDKFLYDANININPSNELMCFAFYSDKPNTSAVFKYKGIFSMKIDTKKNTITAKQSHIAPEDVLLRLYLGRQQYVKFGFNGFILTNVILKKDGSAIYIAEQRVMREVQKKSGVNEITSKFQYYYNSIIVFKLNADLSLSYCNEILKSQYTVNDLGSNSSFAFCYENNNLHFLFNVDVEQKSEGKYKNVKIMNPNKKWETLVISMDSKGNKTEKKLFKEDSKMVIIPRWSTQINNSLILLVSDLSTKPDYGNVLHIVVPESSYMVKLGQVNFR